MPFLRNDSGNDVRAVFDGVLYVFEPGKVYPFADGNLCQWFVNKTAKPPGPGKGNAPATPVLSIHLVVPEATEEQKLVANPPPPEPEPSTPEPFTPSTPGHVAKPDQVYEAMHRRKRLTVAPKSWLVAECKQRKVYTAAMDRGRMVEALAALGCDYKKR